LGQGYVRQSSADIVAGNTIEAGPLNAEFNQVQAAFHLADGHTHDGTTGEGPKLNLTTSTTGVLAVAQGGTGGIHKVNGTTLDDSGEGFAVGSLWLDTTNDRAYICVDSTDNAAVWVYVGNTVGWQPLDGELTALAGLTSAADRLPYFTGSGTASLATFTSFGRSLVDDADASAGRSTLGLVIGTNVQAWDAHLDDLAAISPNQGDVIYFNGTDWVALGPGTSGHFLKTNGAGANPAWAAASASDAELAALAGLSSAADKLPYFTGSGTADLADFTAFARTLVDDADAATARTTLGVGTGNTPQFTGIEVGHASDTTLTRSAAGILAVEGVTVPLNSITNTHTAQQVEIGHASDTTLARSSAGNLSIEGNLIYRAGGTDVPVTDGGTGASTAADAATNLGLGTGDSPQFTGINVGHASDTTVTRSEAGVIAVEGVPIYPNIPQNSKSEAYTLVLADAQKHILHPSTDNNARTFTIPANSSVAYPIGTAITFINEINTVTIAITTDTLVLAGTGSTGSRTLAANGVATAIKVGSTRWYISGTGLT
jgi:hypothetical protein